MQGRQRAVQIEARLPWGSDGETSYESPYTNLAAAIVMIAVKDYIRLLKKSWEKGLTVEAERRLVIEKTELEGFFYSPWYETLTDIDPENLMRQCTINAFDQEKAHIQKQNRKHIREMKRTREIEKNNETEKINEMEENTQ